MALDRFALLFIVFHIAIGSAQYVRDNYRNGFHFIQNINPIQSSHLDGGNGIRDANSKWPRYGNKIVIPFIIDRYSSYSKRQIDQIYSAMRHISAETCIHFKWRSNEDDFLWIYSGKWCTSFIGRVGGVQRLSLQRDSSCSNDIGTIIHELVHALGFLHMQSHADRDRYVSVIKENICPSEWYQFDKVSSYRATNYGTPYDYLSIMHYGTHAFSRNGGPTIVAKNIKFNQYIGQTNKLSLGDVTRIRMMYNCECLESGMNSC